MKKIFIILLSTLFILGCKKSKYNQDEPLLESKLCDNVVLLNETTKDRIKVVQDGLIIIKGVDGIEGIQAKGVSSTTDNIQVGTVLVCEPIPGTAPDGVFRVVTGIQENTDAQYGAGYNNLTTIPTTLEEFIENVDGEDKQSFMVESVKAEQGVTYTINSQSINLNINKTFTQNSGPKSSMNFSVEGNIKFERDLKFGLKIKNRKIERVKLEMESKDHADIKVSGDMELATEKEWPLMTIKGKRISFNLNGIPVWMRPVFTIKFKVDASGKLAFDVDIVKIDREYSRGIIYEDGSWRKDNNDNYPQNNLSPFNIALTLEGKCKFALEADFTAEIYEKLIGLGVSGSAYTKIDNRATYGEPTKADFITGIDFTANVTSSFFQKN